MILSSKTSPLLIKTAIFSSYIQQVFKLKSLLERLKRDFDDCKSIFFRFKESDRFLILTCYFANFDGLSADNMISDVVRS